MNRSQKKCVIASAGVHVLLLVILFVGPAFFAPRPKADDSRILDVIPSTLIEKAFDSGVKDAQPPAPAPVPQVAPPPVVVPPTPVVTPPPPVPKVVPPEPVKTPDDLKPVERTPDKPVTKPVEHTIKVNTKLVTRNTPKNTSVTDSRAVAREQQRRAQALRTALRALKTGLSSATIVDMPGNSSAAYANYKDALASIYYDAWTTPEGVADNEANTTVRITVAADGTVINARIITPSGNDKVDASVQRALDRVSSVPPLPDQSKAQREFTLLFNLKTKRMLE